MKVYICGPTDQELRQTQERFAHWENNLRELGYEVINPMSFDHAKAWGDDQEERLKQVAKCDCIFLLNSWYRSAIARKELVYAQLNGLKFYTELSYNIIEFACSHQLT